MMDEAKLQLESLRDFLPDHVRSFPEEKQIEFVSVLLSQNHRQQREHEEMLKAYKQLCKMISEHYKPLHPHLYHLSGWELVPSFREMVESGNEEKMRSILTEETPGVFTFNILTDKCCREFVEEINHFELWCKENKLHINRPNTMNRYGVILDDFGFKPVLDEVVQKYVQPFASFLYPILGQQLDSHHGFVVEYGLDKDVNLGFHVDESEITLNVCLGQEFTGSDLYFKGVRCERHVHCEPMEEECYDLKHRMGKGILHVGRHRNGVRDITSGYRYNLILWCRSSVYRKKYGLCHSCEAQHTPDYSWCGLCQEVVAQSVNLFDEAMREGYVSLEMLKMMISGVAGSGKTSTLALLLDQDPPAIRQSTPCARRPVQVIPMMSADTEDEMWSVLEGVKLKGLLADLVKNHEKPDLSSTLDAAEVLKAGASTVGPTAITTTGTVTAEDRLEASLLQERQNENPSILAEDGTENSGLQEASATEDELVKLIDQSRGHKVRLKRRFIIITDTGGQPQFQEVVPVFLRQTSLYIHVQKLSESLSEYPVIEYYDKQGKPLSEAVRSPLTNEEHVKSAVRSLQSLRHNVAEDKSPQMLFIATHEDLEGNCRETREEKEERMAKLLLPVAHSVIYCGNRMKKVLFGINAKCPGDKEKRIAADIRNIIRKLFPCNDRKIPLRWFVLQLKLQEVAGILQRQIISKKECLEAAHRIHLNSEVALDAALKYLDELNIIFYYPKILPNVVFCSIQVVIDKLTELVEHLYKLMKDDDDDHTAIMGDWKRFRDFGLITESILAVFPTHYAPGIFTVDDLITLFRALLVIADLQKNDQGVQEYFMPCLLHTIEPKEVEKHIAGCKSDVPPLIVHFPNCLLAGVFCFTIASLLSSENTMPAPWKLKQLRDGSPKCLYRNIVQFIVPDFPGTVTLADMFDFIQIIVASPPSFCTELCPLVKNAVLASLTRASQLLNYIDCRPSVAVFCQCGVGKPHPAEIKTDPMGKQWWVCTEDDSICKELKEGCYIWKGKEMSFHEPVHMRTNRSREPICDQSITVLKVSRALESLVDWCKLGLLLEIPKTKLDMIRLDYDKYGQSCQKDEMIDLWLQSDMQASWDKLCTALESMNENSLASRIRSGYCSCI